MPNPFDKVFQLDTDKMCHTDNPVDKPRKPVTGRPSAAVEEAIRLMKEEGYTAYAAAKKVGIATNTIYRSRLYRDLKGMPHWVPPPKKESK